MPDNNKGAKVPLNPFYVSMPFVFKRTGEVKRTETAERFSKKLSIRSNIVANNTRDALSLTVSDAQTTYILSRAQTKILLSDESNVPAMVINGWIVEQTTEENRRFLPLTQIEISELA